MPTKKQAFDSRSQRRWFAIGGLFTPYYMTPADGSTPVGCQTMVMQDIESQCFLEQWNAPRKPAPFTSDEVLAFTDRVFAKHGKPKQGLLVLPSVWRSSQYLHDDETTHQRLNRLG
jgi:hypothetical protein